MKKVLLLAVLLLPTLYARAQNTSGYAVIVHVSASSTVLVPHPTGPSLQQELKVTIDGKKYDLSAPSDGSLLALGDYKAKLVQDNHKTRYESFQIYEFQFPDKKTVRFTVIGQRE